MKFKHRATGANSLELSSTRTVTFFLSPEFGHMVVDGKCADSNVLDRGKVIMEIELAFRGYSSHNQMQFAHGDFKCDPNVYITRAKLSIHDTELGLYTNTYRPTLISPGVGGYVWDVQIPKEFHHHSELLKLQIKTMVGHLES